MHTLRTLLILTVMTKVSVQKLDNVKTRTSQYSGYNPFCQNKASFPCSEESTLKISPLSHTPPSLVPKNMLSHTFRFWLKLCFPSSSPYTNRVRTLFSVHLYVCNQLFLESVHQCFKKILHSNRDLQVDVPEKLLFDLKWARRAQKWSLFQFS